MEKQEQGLVLALAASIIHPSLGIARWRELGAPVGGWGVGVAVMWALQLGLTARALPEALRGVVVMPGLVLANLIGTFWLAGFLLRTEATPAVQTAHRAGYSATLTALSLLTTVLGARVGAWSSGEQVAGFSLALAWSISFNLLWPRVAPPGWSKLRPGASYVFAVLGWIFAIGSVALLLLCWALTTGTLK